MAVGCIIGGVAEGVSFAYILFAILGPSFSSQKFEVYTGVKSWDKNKGGGDTRGPRPLPI